MPEPLVECGQSLWADPYATLYQGDCREVLAQLPEESIQVCVTSPPFWSLRKYEGPQALIWGGKAGCEHQWGRETLKGLETAPYQGYEWQTGGLPCAKTGGNVSQGQICFLCGAWRGAYGLEPNPDCLAWATGAQPCGQCYTCHTVEILRAIRRVLRTDGVVFLHLADSYNSGNSGYGEWTGPAARAGDEECKKRGMTRVGVSTLKPKDLCLIPERVMLAAQADGWWVRSRIAWVKPNPMPESVQDRPSDAWDYIIMFTKSANYFWDMEAVREPQSPLTLEIGSHYKDGMRHHQSNPKAEGGMRGVDRAFALPSGRNLRNVWTIVTEGFGLEMCRACGRIYEPRQFKMLAQKPGSRKCRCRKDDYEASPGDWVEALVEEEVELLGEPLVMETGGLACAACGEVYTLEAWEKLETGRVKVCRCGASDFLSHFATFPLELPTRCILAATSERGNCPKCGKPWVRMVERIESNYEKRKQVGLGGPYNMRPDVLREAAKLGDLGSKTQTLGWQPACKCGLKNTTPALVLDPFAGSGTTLVAAKRLGRRAIGIDLSAEYLALARYRLERENLPLQDLTGDYSTQFPFPSAHPPDVLPEKGECRNAGNTSYCDNASGSIPL